MLLLKNKRADVGHLSTAMKLIISVSLAAMLVVFVVGVIIPQYQNGTVKIMEDANEPSVDVAVYSDIDTSEDILNAAHEAAVDDRVISTSDVWEVSGTTLYHYNGTVQDGDTIKIPNIVDGVYITAIGNGDISVFSGISSNIGFDYVIPKGITTINAHAFSDLKTNADSLVIPETVSSIGNYAFYNAQYKVIYATGAKDVGYCAFGADENKAFLERLVLSSSLASIDSEAVSMQTNLSDVAFVGKISSCVPKEGLHISSEDMHSMQHSMHISSEDVYFPREDMSIIR